MTLRVVGAGYPRTGTTSLKAALERLLGEPCYHMRELFQHREHVPRWLDAYAGRPTDWDRFLAGYAAGVDWPISHFWRELAEQYPEAVVLLSRRESPQQWYASMDRTVLGRPRAIKRRLSWSTRRREDLPPWLADLTPDQLAEQEEIERAIFAGIPEPDDAEAVMADYQRHLDEVRATTDADRLVEWQPRDGWEPLCAALDLPVPDEPFPHENTSEQMTARLRAARMSTD